MRSFFLYWTHLRRIKGLFSPQQCGVADRLCLWFLLPPGSLLLKVLPYRFLSSTGSVLLIFFLSYFFLFVQIFWSVQFLKILLHSNLTLFNYCLDAINKKACSSIVCTRDRHMEQTWTQPLHNHTTDTWPQRRKILPVFHPAYSSSLHGGSLVNWSQSLLKSSYGVFTFLPSSSTVSLWNVRFVWQDLLLTSLVWLLLITLWFPGAYKLSFVCLFLISYAWS